MADVPILPDVLAPGLRVVFCGSAAGTASARAGAYYAGPGNAFWPTLHAVGLTPHRIAPADFRTVLDHGLGLTDLCKTGFGPDATLAREADDAAALAAKITRDRPRILAFNGKRAARVFLRVALDHDLGGYGAQPVRLGPTAIHVLPSTSGQARRWWDERWWREVAEAAGSAKHR